MEVLYQNDTSYVIASETKQSYTDGVLKKQYYLYILTNRTNKVLYVGITDNLIIRMEQHKQHINPLSFTAKYKVDKLVYYEIYKDPLEAITREKQIKRGSRKNKILLIESMNANWHDLFERLFD